MGLALIIIGLLVWLLLGATIIGIVLIVLGVLLFFAGPPSTYGYSSYRGRRAPP